MLLELLRLEKTMMTRTLKMTKLVCYREEVMECHRQGVWFQVYVEKGGTDRGESQGGDQTRLF